MTSNSSPANTPHPRQAIRRFDVFAEYKRLKGLQRGLDQPPAFTSQRRSGCGALVAKGLSVRWHACPDGGAGLQRDHNAAKNRERLGQSLRGDVAVAASENRASIAR
jgi:transposase